MRPRPVFWIFPSSVSAATSLSSTPLMKTLLPGPEYYFEISIYSSSVTFTGISGHEVSSATAVARIR